MRDYNFFSDYIFIQSRFRFKRLILPLMFLVLITIVLGTYIRLEMIVSSREKEIEDQNNFLNAKANREILQDVGLLKDEILVLEEMLFNRDIFKLEIDSGYTVTEELTQDIVASIPQNVQFKNYQINANEVNISALATGYADIAEFENNLRLLNKYDNIFVSNIEYGSDDELYAFGLTIILEEVIYD